MDWQTAWFNLWHLGVAYILALPVALDREQVSQSAGLRTFPLVAVAACGYALVGMGMLDSTDAEARVIQGVITGIGFIGGGAILKNGASVSGMSTAASIWTTGLIGIAVATDRIEIAAILAIITFTTMRVGRALKNTIAETDQE